MGDDLEQLLSEDLSEAEELITVLAATLHEGVLRNTEALRLIDAYRNSSRG